MFYKDFFSQQTLVFILFSCVFFRRSLGKRSKRRNFPTVKTEKNSNLLALLAYNTLACVARAKGKGKGGGNKLRGKKEGRRRGTGEERREGSACSHAIVFFSAPTFPLSNQNEAELVCLLLLPGELSDICAHVQDFLHVGRYTNVNDKR